MKNCKLIVAMLALFCTSGGVFGLDSKKQFKDYSREELYTALKTPGIKEPFESYYKRGMAMARKNPRYAKDPDQLPLPGREGYDLNTSSWALVSVCMNTLQMDYPNDTFASAVKKGVKF